MAFKVAKYKPSNYYIPKAETWKHAFLIKYAMLGSSDGYYTINNKVFRAHSLALLEPSNWSVAKREYQKTVELLKTTMFCEEAMEGEAQAIEYCGQVEEIDVVLSVDEMKYCPDEQVWLDILREAYVYEGVYELPCLNGTMLAELQCSSETKSGLVRSCSIQTKARKRNVGSGTIPSSRLLENILSSRFSCTVRVEEVPYDLVERFSYQVIHVTPLVYSANIKKLLASVPRPLFVIDSIKTEWEKLQVKNLVRKLRSKRPVLFTCDYDACDYDVRMAVRQQTAKPKVSPSETQFTLGFEESFLRAFKYFKSILIIGDTGTGKTRLTKLINGTYIHHNDVITKHIGEGEKRLREFFKNPVVIIDELFYCDMMIRCLDESETKVVAVCREITDKRLLGRFEYIFRMPKLSKPVAEEIVPGIETSREYTIAELVNIRRERGMKEIRDKLGKTSFTLI